MMTNSMPFVTTDEDGETAYTEGHIEPPERFVRALIANAVYDGWDVDFADLDRDSMAADVQYIWWRERFPDDEFGEKCAADDLGAIPLTMVENLYEHIFNGTTGSIYRV